MVGQRNRRLRANIEGVSDPYKGYTPLVRKGDYIESNSNQAATFLPERVTPLPLYPASNGKSRWPDNVYVERLWCSLKQKEVYRHAYETVAQTRKGIADNLRCFNEERLH